MVLNTNAWHAQTKKSADWPESTPLSFSLRQARTDNQNLRRDRLAP